MSINELRWKRVTEAKMSFTYIKLKVKKIYDYEVKEVTLEAFIKNISDYKNIKEGILLSHIEENIYRKLRIFSMKDLKKYDKHPIENALTSPMFKMVFDMKNNITIKPGEFYEGDLDSCYRVVYYKEDSSKFEFKLACIKKDVEINTSELGIQDEKEVYI